jgi:hypothetical protein
MTLLEIIYGTGFCKFNRILIRCYCISIAAQKIVISAEKYCMSLARKKKGVNILNFHEINVKYCFRGVH